MSEKIYLYPIWIRIWHGINALMFLVLIITGISMQYSNPDYPIIRFDLAVSFHNIGGVVITIIFFFFIIINRFSFNRKYYRFKRKGFIKRMKKQLRFYMFGIFRHEPPPYSVSKKRKFNPLQKLSYLIVMYILMPMLIISGLALLYPEVIFFNLFGISGIHITDLVHVTTGFLLSIFMIIHIYICTIGITTISNFKGMISGWHGS